MDFNVNVNVKLDATPALLGAVTALAGVVKTAEVSRPATTVLPGSISFVPTSPTSEEKQEQVATALPQQQASPTTQAATEQPKEISDEQLRAIVGPKSKEHGKDKVFAILDEFGVKRVPDLKQEQRQAFIEKMNAL